MSLIFREGRPDTFCLAGCGVWVWAEPLDRHGKPMPRPKDWRCGHCRNRAWANKVPWWKRGASA